MFLTLLHNGSIAAAEQQGKGILSYSGFADVNPEKNFCILVGDTQERNHLALWRERNNRERRLIADEIARRDPAFVIFLGDLTVRGSSRRNWRDFDELHSAYVAKRIPLFPILGNHELKGRNKICFRNYFGRFPYLEKRRWYSFTWKNIAFIMLDSNFSSLTRKQENEQSEWYLAELARFEKAAEVDYVIVCCHHPPFTNSRVVRPNKKVRRLFADPFLRFQKTRLFFSGHVHSYERFQIEDKYFIVSGGGGGPRHKVAPQPARGMYPDQFKGPALRFFHFCELGAGEKELNFRVILINSDGTSGIVDTVNIP